MSSCVYMAISLCSPGMNKHWRTYLLPVHISRLTSVASPTTQQTKPTRTILTSKIIIRSRGRGRGRLARGSKEGGGYETLACELVEINRRERVASESNARMRPPRAAYICSGPMRRETKGWARTRPVRLKGGRAGVATRRERRVLICMSVVLSWGTRNAHDPHGGRCMSAGSQHDTHDSESMNAEVRARNSEAAARNHVLVNAPSPCASSTSALRASCSPHSPTSTL
jgi:hypothetical protein